MGDPRVQVGLQGLRRDLPAPTLIVMAVSDFFVAYWWVMPRSSSVRYSVSFLLRRSTAFATRWTDSLLPIIGGILEKATIARWTRTLATMFAAGVPLVESLDASRARRQTRYTRRHPQDSERGQHRYEPDQRDA
jgi:type II secretory pathway component PulF